MSSDAFAQSFDSRFHATFARLGMGAGTGTYTPPPSVAVPEPASVSARVFTSRGQASMGDFRQSRLQTMEIGYLRADVTPATDGRLVLDGVTWVNVEEVEGSGDLRTDASMSVWAVRRG